MWDTDTAACLKTLEGPDPRICDVISLYGGRQVAAASADKTIEIRDTGTGVCIRTLEGHHDAITSLTASPDDTRLVPGLLDNTIKLWDVNKGTCLRTLKNDGGVWSVYMLSDSKYIISVSSDQIFMIWDVGNEFRCKVLDHNHSNLMKAVFSPDGRYVALCVDRTVRLSDVNSSIRTSSSHSKTSGAHDMSGCAIIFVSDGTYFVSGSLDGVGCYRYLPQST